MFLKVCIVEDNAEACNRLQECLAQYGAEKDIEFSIKAYSDPIVFLEEYRGSADVLFMDIELPHMNGLETVKKVREFDKNVIVVFVTNMAQYAINGYEVDALDFIVKPVSYFPFSVKMGRVVTKFKLNRNDEIWINDRNNKRRLKVDDITYIEVMRHNVVYHTVNGNFQTYDQLANVCESLKDAPFALCNRCFLVNLRHVSLIEDFSVTVDGEVLQVSRSKRTSFIKSLNEYLGRGK